MFPQKTRGEGSYNLQKTRDEGSYNLQKTRGENAVQVSKKRAVKMLLGERTTREAKM